MTLRAEIDRASERLLGRVRRTPTQHSPRLSRLSGAEVFLKLENHQLTGSFKVRGAFHKLLCLSPSALGQGVVSASSGNHGAGLAFAAAKLGCQAEVFVPETADDSKVKAIRHYGARVHVHGSDCVQAEAEARRYAGEHNGTYVSPYNDREVMVGQGTMAREILEDAGAPDAIFIALGGGGLISGVGGYLKAVTPDVRVMACSPERSPAMHRCLEAGAIIDVPCFDTLSDATAGGVEPGSITLASCQDVIDRSLLLSEGAIAQATRSLIEDEHLLVEGAAGLALAGFLAHVEEFQQQRVVIVLCGANLGKERLRALFSD